VVCGLEGRSKGQSKAERIGEERWEPCQDLGCKCDGHKAQGHGCERTDSTAWHRGAGHIWVQKVDRDISSQGPGYDPKYLPIVNRSKQKGVFVF